MASELSADPPDAPVLWGRYHRAVFIVVDAEGTCLAVRPQTGDKQGDGPVAERFILAQGPVLDRWCTESGDLLEHAALDCWDDAGASTGGLHTIGNLLMIAPVYVLRLHLKDWCGKRSSLWRAFGKLPGP